MEISSAQMQQAAAPSDSGAAAADGGVAPERSRVARLMEVVSLAGGTAEHLCEALLRVGPDAEDLMVLRVRPPLAPFHLRLARGHPGTRFGIVIGPLCTRLSGHATCTHPVCTLPADHPWARECNLRCWGLPPTPLLNAGSCRSPQRSSHSGMSNCSPNEPHVTIFFHVKLHERRGTSLLCPPLTAG